MSTHDSFTIWRDFRRIWQDLHEERPDGFEAEVTIYFKDGESIVPAHVWRDNEYLVFSQGGDTQQDIRIAAVREDFIARIDCRYVKTKDAKTSTGFGITEKGEPPPLPAPEAEGDQRNAVC